MDRSPRLRFLFRVGCSLVGALSAVAAPPPDPLFEVASALSRAYGEKPAEVLEAQLSKPFLESVPLSEMAPKFAEDFQEHGPVERVSLVARRHVRSGHFRFHFRDRSLQDVRLTISGGAPAKGTGLWVSSIRTLPSSWGDWSKALSKVDPSLSVVVARLGPRGPKVLASLNPDAPRALASAFKLYVLGALIREHLPWDQTLALEARARSFPSGILQDWNPGTSLTLESLATLMISLSDNTATDQLIYFLGRSKLGEAFRSMGNLQPERSWPYLTTRETFVFEADPKLAQRYLDTPPEAKVEFLDRVVAQVPPANVLPNSNYVWDRGLDWFASASDLVRALDWLRVHSPKAQTILASSAPEGISAEDYPYQGYKGGSSQGILSGNWLLRDRNGTWLAISGTWNGDPEVGPPEGFFASLREASQLALLLGTQAAGEGQPEPDN